MPKRLSLAAARRVALAAQGFHDPDPKGEVTVRHLRRALGRMAVLQLDSVNVLCRSHYLPLFARLGQYDQAKLDSLIYDSGRYFEYLAHEASIISQELHPALRWRMGQVSWRQALALESSDSNYVESVRVEVAERGPLSVKDLSDPGQRTGPWWGMPRGKMALEWLYATGRLAIARRTSTFLTVYDVPERVIDTEILAAPTLNPETAQRQLLELASRSHGVGTAKDLIDYFRLRKRDAAPILAEMVNEGQLVEVAVEGWNDQAFMHPGAVVPRRIEGAALLTPFDPVVWFRERAERLFGFRYRIEIYVPASKRQYGYYVLPFMVDGEMVGRVDLKADRKNRVLLAKAVHHEDGVDIDHVAGVLGQSLTKMARWLELDGVEVAPVGNLSEATARSLPVGSLKGSVTPAT